MSIFDLQGFLEKRSAAKSLITAIHDKFETRVLTGSLRHAKETLDALRILLDQYRFSDMEEMAAAVRSLGEKLSSAVIDEIAFAVDNAVLRVLNIMIEEQQRLGSTSTSCLSSKLEDLEMAEKDEINSGNGYVNGDGDGDGQDRDDEEEQDLDLDNNSDSDQSQDQDDLDLGLDKRGSRGGVGVGDGLTDQPPGDLRSGMILALDELLAEITGSTSAICEEAVGLFGTEEIILTAGHSGVIEEFIKAAARKRKIQVIVAEGLPPSLSGHLLASKLCQWANQHRRFANNIGVTLIPDSNIYAVMPRVHKVIFSPVTVMRDGSCISNAGQLAIAIAAKDYSVPLIGVANTFLFSPLTSEASGQRDRLLSQTLAPSSILPYHSDVDLYRQVEVIVPAFDFVPQKLVSTYVTNTGCYLPNNLRRFMSELYGQADHEIELLLSRHHSK